MTAPEFFPAEHPTPTEAGIDPDYEAWRADQGAMPDPGRLYYEVIDLVQVRMLQSWLDGVEYGQRRAWQRGYKTGYDRADKRRRREYERRNNGGNQNSDQVSGEREPDQHGEEELGLHRRC